MSVSGSRLATDGMRSGGRLAMDGITPDGIVRDTSGDVVFDAPHDALGDDLVPRRHVESRLGGVVVWLCGLTS